MQSISALAEALEPVSVKGFLDSVEGHALHHYALVGGKLAPCLEIGSYCGKSTVYLGTACREVDTVLYAVDHHRGSEEHQPGEFYHDPELHDAGGGGIDSFPEFRRTLQTFALEDHVIPVVTHSQTLLKQWGQPLGMVFVDGGHSHAQAMTDCCGWSRFVAPGGFLAVHDIFADTADGGQGPFLALQAVLEEGNFTQIDQVQSLAILQRDG